jgi:diphthine-ammonia ligase
MAGVIGMVPATLDIIRGEVDTAMDTTEARRAWRSAAAVARVTGSTLGRDCLSCTVYAAAAHGDGAIRIASDEVFAEVMRGEGWQDDVDVPGGPNAAQAGVHRGPSGVHRNGADSRSSMAVAGDGSGFGSSEQRRWSWDPLVTHVTVPGLPKDAMVEVSPCCWTATGRAGGWKAVNRGTAT